MNFNNYKYEHLDLEKIKEEFKKILKDYPSYYMNRLEKL